MPRRKKDPSTRARRNKASTASTLKKPLSIATSQSESYDGLTVAQLKAEIVDRNFGRVVESRLPVTGSKAALLAVLVADDSPDLTPPLPLRTDGWHSMTTDMWADIWASPMSVEWDDSDLHNLYILASIYDDIWCASDARGRKDAAVEYRLQRADLGLSPYSRRRLEWTIETAAEAKDRGAKRRSGQPKPNPAPTSTGVVDPRAALHLVN